MSAVGATEMGPAMAVVKHAAAATKNVAATVRLRMVRAMAPAEQRITYIVANV
jgi:hypothetical protein